MNQFQFIKPDEFVQLLGNSGLLNDEQLSIAQKLGGIGQDSQSIAAALVGNGSLTPWQAKKLLSGESDVAIGKYRLLDLVAENDRHLVYLGVHPQMDRRVDVRVARVAEDDAEVTREFIAKARELADVNHPHVAHVFDFDDDDGKCYLVSEHVDGEPLTSWNEQRDRKQSHDLVHVMLQIAGALAYLRRQGIRLGELDPSQVLVDSSGNAKICGLWESCRIEEIDDPVSAVDRDVTSLGGFLNELLQVTGSGCATASETDRGISSGGHGNDSWELQDLAKRMVDGNDRPMDMDQVVVQLRRLLDRLTTKDRRDGYQNSTPESGSLAGDSIGQRIHSKWYLSKFALIGYRLAAVVLMAFSFALWVRDGHSRSAQRVAEGRAGDRTNGANSRGEPSKPRARRPRRPPTQKTKDGLDLAAVGAINNPQAQTTDVNSQPDSAASDTTILDADGPPPAEPIDEPPQSIETPVEPVSEPDRPADQPPTPNSTSLPTNLFVDLVPAVNLPVIAKHAPSKLSLGKLLTSDDTQILLDVVGSETAHRASIVFSTSPSDGKHEWRLQLAKSNNVSSAEQVASVFAEDNQLLFQWRSETKQPAIARHLANCQLRLRSGDHQHLIWLREGVAMIDPVRIACPSPTIRVKLPISVPPHPQGVRLEVIELGPELTNAEIEPRGESPVGDDPVRIRVGDKKRKRIEFEISIDTQRSSAWVATVTPKFLSPVSNEWIAMTDDIYQRTGQEIIVAKRSIPQLKQKFKALKKSLQESRTATDSRLADMSAEHTRRIRHVESAYDELQILGKVVNQVNGARFRIRLSYKIGDASMDLVRSREFY